jgi:hypothetical protein
MPFVTNVSAKMKTSRNEKCVYRSIMTGAATTSETRKDDSGDMGKLKKGVKPSGRKLFSLIFPHPATINE